ncbi:hypothetical protein VPHK436_0005 [Vibrio phage K436]
MYRLFSTINSLMCDIVWMCVYVWYIGHPMGDYLYASRRDEWYSRMTTPLCNFL